MSHELSPDTESFIQGEIDVGAFQSREDALEAGVEMLRRRRELVNRLTESRRQLDDGEYVEFDDGELQEYFAQLILRAEGKSEKH
jgi:Arc/MetJ-type ribon-helix-helix transcriptional regulator